MKLLLPAILLASVLISCEEVHQIILTDDEQKTIDFFNDVALGFDNQEGADVTRRWENQIQIYVHGTPSEELIDELLKISTNVSSAASTSEILVPSISSNPSFSNYDLYFSSAEEYANAFPSLSSEIEDNPAFYIVEWNSENEIIYGTMYIDIERITDIDEQKHLLRKSFTQSLGFGRETDLSPSSIFSPNGSAQTFSQLDREAIRLLYHPDMTTGLNEAQATETITNILFDER